MNGSGIIQDCWMSSKRWAYIPLRGTSWYDATQLPHRSSIGLSLRPVRGGKILWLLFTSALVGATNGA
eukprot:709389-Ditylum_brightwellii.AAC.1